VEFFRKKSLSKVTLVEIEGLNRSNSMKLMEKFKKIPTQKKPWAGMIFLELHETFNSRV
jgi:hypothetical protein